MGNFLVFANASFLPRSIKQNQDCRAIRTRCRKSFKLFSDHTNILQIEATIDFCLLAGLFVGVTRKIPLRGYIHESLISRLHFVSFWSLPKDICIQTSFPNLRDMKSFLQVSQLHIASAERERKRNSRHKEKLNALQMSGISTQGTLNSFCLRSTTLMCCPNRQRNTFRQTHTAKTQQKQLAYFQDLQR